MINQSLTNKYCATCGVPWSNYGGFYHRMNCKQFLYQFSADAVDAAMCDSCGAKHNPKTKCPACHSNSDLNGPVDCDNQQCHSADGGTSGESDDS